MNEDPHWAAITGALDAVLPTAERDGARLTAQPTDPSFSSIGLAGAHPVVGSLDGGGKFFVLASCNRRQGLNFCQSTIGGMGADLRTIG
jgi:D-mannonate dehydratase